MTADPHELGANLPPHNGQEPSALRTDIIDELTDHLSCAERDESRAGRSAADARIAAVQRFGDPTTVARRLWLDAMKGTIMKQQLTIALLMTVAAALLLMVLLLWRSLRIQEQAVSELVASLKTQQTSMGEVPSEWNRLTVKCLDADGQPLSGVHVQVTPYSENNRGIPPQSKTSDHTGLLDFHQVLYGAYLATATYQSAEMSFQKTEIVSVMPGRDEEATIRFPGALQPVRVDCEFEEVAQPGDELEGRFWVVATLIPTKATGMFDGAWDRVGVRDSESYWLLIGPNGQSHVERDVADLQLDEAALASFRSERVGRFAQNVFRVPTSDGPPRLPMGGYLVQSVHSLVQDASGTMLSGQPVPSTFFTRYAAGGHIIRLAEPTRERPWVAPSKPRREAAPRFHVSEPYKLQVPADEIAKWHLTLDAPDGMQRARIDGALFEQVGDVVPGGFVQLEFHGPSVIDATVVNNEVDPLVGDPFKVIELAPNDPDVGGLPEYDLVVWMPLEFPDLLIEQSKLKRKLVVRAVADDE